jgi:hypothetical protein
MYLKSEGAAVNSPATSASCRPASDGVLPYHEGSNPLEGPVSSSQIVYAQKRRSTRIDKSVPLAVQGVGAFRAPYQEQVTTQTISCHGCTFQSKHEVIQGDVVFLDVKQPAQGEIGCSNRGRVKWVQRLNSKDQAFKVAVELELPGNIWGIASPPEDWFPVQEPKAIEAANPGRELRVVRRTEPQMVALPEASGAPVSPSARNEATTSLSGSLAQVVVGLGEQIKVMASEAATTTLVREKSRLLAEFRAQLQDETAKILESVVAASRQELTQRMVKELNQAHEAAARATYERWNKKIEQDMAIAGQRLVNHGKAVSQHIDGLAAGTMARLHREMESTRGEAVDRFLSRLRERVVPMLEDAQTALQKLAASEDMFREQSEAISARFQGQVENSVKEILAKACEEQDKRAAAVVEESARNLVKLSNDCEKAAQNHLRSLIASATDYTRKALEQRSAEISRQYAAQLEGYTRSYLESISELIAAIPSKAATQSRD